MDEELQEIADAMGVSVDDARYIFDAVGSINAVEIVRGLMIDSQTEESVEEAAQTDEDWWQDDKEWWE